MARQSGSPADLPALLPPSRTRGEGTLRRAQGTGRSFVVVRILKHKYYVLLYDTPCYYMQHPRAKTNFRYIFAYAIDFPAILINKKLSKRGRGRV